MVPGIGHGGGTRAVVASRHRLLGGRRSVIRAREDVRVEGEREYPRRLHVAVRRYPGVLDRRSYIGGLRRCDQQRRGQLTARIKSQERASCALLRRLQGYQASTANSSSLLTLRASLSVRARYSNVPASRARPLTTTRCGIPIISLSATTGPGRRPRSSRTVSMPAADSCW